MIQRRNLGRVEQAGPLLVVGQKQDRTVKRGVTYLSHCKIRQGETWRLGEWLTDAKASKLTEERIDIR